jgi:hypothetical protein
MDSYFESEFWVEGLAYLSLEIVDEFGCAHFLKFFYALSGLQSHIRDCHAD